MFFEKETIGKLKNNPFVSFLDEKAKIWKKEEQKVSVRSV